METLPYEMLEKVSSYLTPQDLSRCCTVCHNWRELFNQDWLWKPLCDPALEEPLATTPCVVEPVFVPPASETSTLTSISRWRLTFLKQNHLWKNWNQGNCKKEEILELDDEFQRDFLTNALLVRWYRYRIEIWDVNSFPVTFLAATVIKGVDYCSVFGSQGLFVQHKSSVKVFHVDPLNKKNIELKHNIFWDENVSLYTWSGEYINLTNGSIYVHLNINDSLLDIIDLENGIKIKTECFPLIGNENKEVEIHGIKSSSSTDHMIVMLFVPWNHIGEKYHCYIYNLIQLTFFPGPVHKCWSGDLDYFAIHGDYLAVGDNLSLIVYNVHTSESIYTLNFNCHIKPSVFNDNFIFVTEDSGNHKGWFGMFSPTNKTLTVICQLPGAYTGSLTVINNKFVKVTSRSKVEVAMVDTLIGMWETSGQTFKPYSALALKPDFFPCFYGKINQACTRVIGWSSIYSYW